MCDYCGCQAVTPISDLTSEHDTVVWMSAATRTALRDGDLDGAAALCRSIVSVLRPHTRVEEDALFPAMADEFPEQLDRLRAEHRAVEAPLREAIDATPSDPGWPQRVEEALYLLREHILKEENDVFPAALATLGPDAWDRLEAVRAAVGRAAVGRATQTGVA